MLPVLDALIGRGPSAGMIDVVVDHLYLIVTGAGTARRVPGLLPQLAQLGPRLVVIPTPNAARVVSLREMVLALPPESPHRVVESYFDEAILPSPPFGLVVVAPCSFDSLNKLAAGIADNLALSVVAEAIGRGTPVVVAISVNPPLWNHPRARASAAALREWGVDVIDPAPAGDVITMAPDDVLIDRVRGRLESP
jgi:phosphopantothenoylcysteine synthetase/decarboxylase